MSKIYFFRHAQASFGAKNYDKLSEKGIEQSRILGAYLNEKNIQFNQVFTGPLERQIHTQQLVAEAYNTEMPSPKIIDNLREHSGTEAMRGGLEQLKNEDPKVIGLFKQIAENPELKKRNTMLAFKHFMELWVNGKIEVEGVEPWARFRENARHGLAEVISKTNKGENIAVFSSGGTISAITAEALGIENEIKVANLNFSVRNTSFSTFFASKNSFNLLSFNELPHLSDELITFV